MSSNISHTVVVTIFLHQARLTKLEAISLDQCFRVLKNYEIRIIKPQSLKLGNLLDAYEGYGVESFPDSSFKDIGAYSRLLLSPAFYKRFADFEYILIHQLDAFVFKDELQAWCKNDYDFVGAPWFHHFSNDDETAPLIGVGNGGFSLRKVKSHLRVLSSFSYLVPPRDNWNIRMATRPRGLAFLRQLGGFILDQFARNNTFWLLNSFMGFEDQFWSLVAPRNFSWFKIPSIEDAMKFSIEMQPLRVFKMNENRLPFGCHAWWKYDLEFWKPYIEANGYEV